MSIIALAILGHIACGVLFIFAGIRDYKLEFGRVTRGDVCFCCLMGTLGWLSLPASLTFILYRRFKGFWDKTVF